MAGNSGGLCHVRPRPTGIRSTVGRSVDFDVSVRRTTGRKATPIVGRVPQHNIERFRQLHAPTRSHPSSRGMAPMAHMMLVRPPQVAWRRADGVPHFAILAVFIAGLMVGRTPEYLGKKIQAAEMKPATLHPGDARRPVVFAVFWVTPPAVFERRRLRRTAEPTASDPVGHRGRDVEMFFCSRWSCTTTRSTRSGDADAGGAQPVRQIPHGDSSADAWASSA